MIAGIHKSQIEKLNVLLFSNKWDLSNYNAEKMTVLNKESYSDLKGIPLTTEFKCQSLARDSLGLFAYVK